MTESTQALLVLTSFPDDTGARKLAETLIDRQLAACVNILQASISFYRWQGRIETTVEVPVLIKTTLYRYEAVEQAIKALHPYELPEIIAVSINNGLPSYLQWIAHETNEADI